MHAVVLGRSAWGHHADYGHGPPSWATTTTSAAAVGVKEGTEVFGSWIVVVYLVGNIAYIGALLALGWELGRLTRRGPGGMLRTLGTTVVGIAIVLLIVLSGFLGLAFPLIVFGIAGSLMWVGVIIFPLGALVFVTIGHLLGERHTAFERNG